MQNLKSNNIKRIKSAIQMLDERPIDMGMLDEIIDNSNIKMPFVKKYADGMVEVFNGTSSLYTNESGLKSINDELLKQGQEYVSTATKQGRNKGSK